MARKRLGKWVGVIVLIGLAWLAWLIFIPGPLAFADGKKVELAEYSAGKPTGVPADFQDTDPIARGKYLAVAADCEACQPSEGGQPFAGGRPFDTEFGTLYSPNITPDQETGIGSWTDAEFLKAMHEGIGKDGKQLYPAFPYAAYTYLTEEDVLAIKAYLFSVPAVDNNVAPEHTLRSPYNKRGLMTSGRCSTTRTSASSRWRIRRRPGIAARIWPKRSAIAATATRRAPRCRR